MEIREEAMNQCFSDIAANIKKIRKQNDLTQKEMSTLLQIDPQYYARLERGDDPKRCFTLEKIIMACTLFGVAPNDIVSKLPDGDQVFYDRMNVERDIRRSIKELSSEQLRGLKKYVESMGNG